MMLTCTDKRTDLCWKFVGQPTKIIWENQQHRITSKVSVNPDEVIHSKYIHVGKNEILHTHKVK